MGAEAIKALLVEMDLDQLSHELRKELKETRGQRKARAIRRWKWWRLSAARE